MGYFKNRQLELLEVGFSLEQANDAIEREANPKGYKQRKLIELRKLLREASNTGEHVVFTLSTSNTPRRRVIFGVTDLWVETDSGAIRLDLIATARFANREEPRC